MVRRVVRDNNDHLQLGRTLLYTTLTLHTTGHGSNNQTEWCCCCLICGGGWLVLVGSAAHNLLSELENKSHRGVITVINKVYFLLFDFQSSRPKQTYHSVN